MKVEKGSVSRLFLRPVKGAYLNVSATVPAKANPDEFQSIATNEGLVYVQYTASGTANTKFGASMGEHCWMKLQSLDRTLAEVQFSRILEQECIAHVHMPSEVSL